MGRCNIWMGFLTSMNCVDSPRHMRVTLLVTAEGAVVRIQTLVVSCEGILTSEVLLTCNKHLVEIPVGFLAYKAALQNGGFASG